MLKNERCVNLRQNFYLLDQISVICAFIICDQFLSKKLRNIVLEWPALKPFRSVPTYNLIKRILTRK